jgi:hypothetical protein
MRSAVRRLAVLVGVLLAVSASAAQQTLMVPKGTDVTLVFDQAINSKTAKIGDSVGLHVKSDVMVGKHVILKKGTHVSGVISKVDQRQRYGKNAKLRIALNPVRSAFGPSISLEARSKGQYMQGKNSRNAAAATAGGAIIAGPVGLVGGFFIHGKQVKIKVGDVMDTEVAKDTWLKR